MALVALARQALFLALTLSLPMLAASLVAGLAVSFLAAAARASDPVLSVLPRQLAVGAVVLAGGTAGFAALVSFARAVWTAIPTLAP